MSQAEDVPTRLTGTSESIATSSNGCRRLTRIDSCRRLSAVVVADLVTTCRTAPTYHNHVS